MFIPSLDLPIPRSPRVFALALLVALPATNVAAQAKKYKFVVITHATAVPFFVPVKKGAEEAGKARRGQKLTPGEWERRTGMRLQFVYRPRGPSFLVATGRLLNSRLGKGRTTKTGAFGKGSVTSVIFLMVPQVRLRKRLDLMAAADRLANDLPQAIVRNWPE
jgi:hypothetical protein